MQMMPETPTLPERLVLALRLPYLVGCVVLGFLIVVLPALLAQHVETGSTSGSVTYALSLQNTAGSLFIPYYSTRLIM